MVMTASGNGFGGGGFGGGGFGGRNATPEAEEALAKILREIKLNPNGSKGNGLPTGTQTSGQPDLSWFFEAIQNSQPNGLPVGTQTSNRLDGLYTIKQVGSKLLGYPGTGVFNAPNPNAPKGLLDSPQKETLPPMPQTQEIKGLMR
jgi:hypothetical protein